MMKNKNKMDFTPKDKKKLNNRLIKEVRDWDSGDLGCK